MEGNMHVQGDRLQNYANQTGETPAKLQIYRKRSGQGYDVEVLKKKSGLAKVAQNVFMKIKHIGDEKLSAVETSTILFKAAVMQQAEKTGHQIEVKTPEGANPEELPKTHGVDLAANALLRAVEGVALSKVSFQYDTSHKEKLQGKGVDVSQALPLLILEREDMVAEKAENITKTLSTISESLKDSATEKAPTSAPGKAAGLMTTAESLVGQLDKVPQAFSDAWRSVDKASIVKTEIVDGKEVSKTLFDGRETVKEWNREREAGLISDAQERLESKDFPPGFSIRTKEQYEKPSDYQPPLLQMMKHLEKYGGPEIESEVRSIFSSEKPKVSNVMSDSLQAFLRLPVTERRDPKPALLMEMMQYIESDRALKVRDVARSGWAKEFLAVFAEQKLTPEQATKFKDRLQSSDWNTNTDADKWAKEWLDSDPTISEDFQRSLRLLSQDHSTGMYTHATKLEHTASKRSEGIRFAEDTAPKSFSYKFLPEGKMNMVISQKWLMHHKETGSTDDETQVGSLNLQGVWEFDSGAKIQKASYEARNLQVDGESIRKAANNAVPQPPSPET
ncbi:MAG: hypothetical protein Q8K75_07660 [Chlamydiales bacterium]|nr:hypothetical protein [Chlamydiales bacterium]